MEKISDVKQYVQQLPADKKELFQQLLQTAEENLPAGFELRIAYGMPTFVVPLELYPAGYHCAPGGPLPFLSLAAQKNFFSVYHMGVFAQEELSAWFTAAYTESEGKKPDMGKSCIRFKKLTGTQLDLLAKLFQKMTPTDWIALYEEKFRKK